MSRRLANVLAARGIGRGDRVAVLLPQSPEAVLTHLAAYRLGAVVVPLFTLFGEDGLRFRLGDSGARALVTDAANLGKITAIRAELPALEGVLSIDGPGRGRRISGGRSAGRRMPADGGDRRRTIRPSSPTPPAPPGRRRARCTRTGC